MHWGLVNHGQPHLFPCCEAMGKTPDEGGGIDEEEGEEILEPEDALVVGN